MVSFRCVFTDCGAQYNDGMLCVDYVGVDLGRSFPLHQSQRWQTTWQVPT